MGSIALTKSAAESLLETYGSKIESAIQSEFTYTSIQSELKHMEEILITQAKKVYEYFGFRGSSLEDIKEFEKELNSKIEKALSQVQGIRMLSGPELEEGFVKDLESAQVFNLDLQYKWEEFWQNCVAEVQAAANNAVQGMVPNLAQAIAQSLFSGNKEIGGKIMGGTAFTKGAKMLSYKQLGNRNWTNIGRISETFSECGPTIRKAFLDYLRKHPDTILGKKNIGISANFEEVKTEDGVSYILSIDTKKHNVSLESILKMKKKERDLIFNSLSPDQKDKLLKEINKSYKNKIIRACSGLDQEGRKYLGTAIDKVIKGKDGIDPFGLYSPTAKDLTGILGEIQSMFFLMYISDGKLIKEIEWIGGIVDESGAKPHVDVLFKNFGVQTKNTTKDINTLDYSASFQKFGFMKNKREFTKSSIKEELLAVTDIYSMFRTGEAEAKMRELGMPIDLMYAIETIIGMQTFNVMYVRERERVKGNSRNSKKTILTNKKNNKKYWKAVEEYNPRFADTREKIEVYANICQQIMGMFASKTMYMQMQQTSQGESNTIYIAGGALIISAATIVGQMIQDLEEGLSSFSRFQTTLGAKTEKGSYTIVDMINSGEGQENLNRIEFALKTSYTFVKH